MGNLVGMVGQPSRAGPFKACLEHMAVSALNHARTNRQAQGQSPRLVQVVASIVQITVTIAHRRILLRRAFGFQMGFQCLHDLLHRPAPQSLLLDAAPALGLVAPTTRGGGSQILADMIEIAQEDALLLEHFQALAPDPLGSILDSDDYYSPVMPIKNHQ